MKIQELEREISKSKKQNQQTLRIIEYYKAKSVKRNNPQLSTSKLIETQTSDINTRDSFDFLKPKILSIHEEKLFTNFNLTIDEFRQGIIGRNVVYNSPFGGKIVTLYADDTASGRPHRIVENFIKSILPIYANTHSDNSYFPVSMHLIYKDSIKYIKNAFKAPKNYELLGVGTGCTGAIFRFQDILMQKYGQTFKEPTNPPICLVTQYEHHSNILSWLKYGFKVIPIEHTFQHDWDKGINDLKEKLESNLRSPLIVISTSAASNVTSQNTPLKMVSDAFLDFKHKHPETPIVWCADLAAYVPHARLDIEKLKLDAVFISPHKLTGGPGSCGILIFNTDHYAKNYPPTHPAGGTVNYVVGYDLSKVCFSDDILERESDGTPGILQLIRAGEAFALQDKIGMDYIEKREGELKKTTFHAIKEMNETWKKCNSGCRIDILGTPKIDERSSVFSVLLFDKNGNMYHYKLIQRILNDIFGVQLRSGCNCAGPFGVHLLNEPYNLKKNLTVWVEEIKRGDLSHKPGWVRFNVHYSFTNEDIQYLLFAFKFVTENGAEIASKFYEEREGEYQISPKIDFMVGLNKMTASYVKRTEIQEIAEAKRRQYLLKTMQQMKETLLCQKNK